MDTERVVPVRSRDETFEVYLDYIKNVELEFSKSAYELLESLDLSHLGEKSRSEAK